MQLWPFSVWLDLSDNFGHGNLQIRDGLPAYTNRANEIIREADELMLQIEMLVFPIDQLGSDFIRRKNGNRSAVTDRRCTLHCAAALFHNCSENSRPIVIVEPGKVQFPKVPRVVHVLEDKIYVLRGAYTVDSAGIENFQLLLEEPAHADGEDDPDEVMHIEEDVEKKEDGE